MLEAIGGAFGVVMSCLAFLSLVVAGYFAVRQGRIQSLEKVVHDLRDSLEAQEKAMQAQQVRLDEQDELIASLRVKVDDACDESERRGSALGVLLDAIAESAICMRAPECVNRLVPSVGPVG